MRRVVLHLFLKRVRCVQVDEWHRCGKSSARLARLRLPRDLAKPDRFKHLIFNDIGYVQHDRDERGVLFALLAERYERKSGAITTTLVFSE